MSGRTVGLFSGGVLVLALWGIQVLRLVNEPDRAVAILEGILLAVLTVGGVVGALVGQEIVSGRRWARAEQAAPGSAFALIVVGDVRDDSSLRRVGLYLGPRNLLLLDFNYPDKPGPIREVNLSRVGVVSVEQLDSAMAWETLLEINIQDEPPLWLTIDGWRLRSRRRLHNIAMGAADKIREGALAAQG